MATKVKITRKRGDTYPDRFQITDSVGNAVDVTGYGFKMSLNTDPTPSNTDNQLYQITGVIENAATGEVYFEPTDVQADQLGTYYFDCQMIDTSGRRRTFAQGTYTYEQDITKD